MSDCKGWFEVMDVEKREMFLKKLDGASHVAKGFFETVENYFECRNGTSAKTSATDSGNMRMRGFGLQRAFGDGE